MIVHEMKCVNLPSIRATKPNLKITHAFSFQSVSVNDETGY